VLSREIFSPVICYRYVILRCSFTAAWDNNSGPMKRIRVDNDVFCALKVHSNHVRNFLGENPFTLPAGPGFGGDLPPWREVGDACYG